MTALVQAQQAIAELRKQITQIDPQTKDRYTTYGLVLAGLSLLALALLTLCRATFEPLAWAVLLFTGAFWGWYASRAAGELVTLEGDLYNAETEED